MSKLSAKFNTILRDLTILMFESTWKFLEKRENRFRYINWQ